MKIIFFFFFFGFTQQWTNSVVNRTLESDLSNSAKGDGRTNNDVFLSVHECCP